MNLELALGSPHGEIISLILSYTTAYKDRASPN